MKEIIKTGFAWARYNRERIRWRPRNLQFDSLTASEKKQVDRLWGGVWTKPSYRWHEHYKSVNGKFDARYLPCDVFYLDVLPKLSNLKLAAAWEDKSYYSERFPDIPFPKLLYACIDDQICDSHLSPCSYKDVWETVVNKQSVFVKPSLGSYQGIGSFILSAVDIGDLDFVEALSRTGSNYVIQELIHQHDFFAELNQDSVNIIRINAYCAVFATPFHAPLLQRSMADCHVAMRVALIARGAQAPLLANTAGYALSRCACALTRRLQYG